MYIYTLLLVSHVIYSGLAQAHLELLTEPFHLMLSGQGFDVCFCTLPSVQGVMLASKVPMFGSRLGFPCILW